MKRIALCVLLTCAGCWDFDSLSARLGTDLAHPLGNDLTISTGDGSAPCVTADCPCPGFSCEDFEAALVPPWQFDTSQSSVAEVVTDPHHGGMHALHVTSMGAGAVYARVRNAALVTNPGDTLYLRYWVLVPSAASTSPYTLYAIVETGTTTFAAGVAKDGAWTLSADSIEGDDITKLEVGTWTCAVVEVSSTTASLTIGGAQTSSTASMGAAPTAVNVGISRANQNTTTEAYVDDIVLSTTPIACD